jgi:hypothetical protein
MNWDRFNSIIFTLALFGFYFVLIMLPDAVESGEISPVTALWIQSGVIGLSLGIVGFTLHRFFSDVTNIKIALESRRQ